jgi:hypothetical protein
MIDPQRGKAKADLAAVRVPKVQAENLNQTWNNPNDAVQLSNLGGVLNAFAANSNRSVDRVRALAAVIRAQQYKTSGQAISQKLMAEMLSRH